MSIHVDECVHGAMYRAEGSARTYPTPVISAPGDLSRGGGWQSAPPWDRQSSVGYFRQEPRRPPLAHFRSDASRLSIEIFSRFQCRTFSGCPFSPYFANLDRSETIWAVSTVFHHTRAGASRTAAPAHSRPPTPELYGTIIADFPMPTRPHAHPKFASPVSPDLCALLEAPRGSIRMKGARR